MKITMYELLGLVKDGKIPKRIIYDQFVYVWNSKIENYQREVDENTTLNWDYITINCLKEPVEILEEEKKIPEKLDYCEEHLFDNNVASFLTIEERRLLDSNFKELGNKINSIIDYLKSKGDE